MRIQENVPQFKIPPLEPGREYHFQVYAVNAKGRSDPPYIIERVRVGSLLSPYGKRTSNGVFFWLSSIFLIHFTSVRREHNFRRSHTRRDIKPEESHEPAKSTRSAISDDNTGGFGACGWHYNHIYNRCWLCGNMSHSPTYARARRSPKKDTVSDNEILFSPFFFFFNFA